MIRNVWQIQVFLLFLRIKHSCEIYATDRDGTRRRRAQQETSLLFQKLVRASTECCPASAVTGVTLAVAAVSSTCFVLIKATTQR